MQNRTLGKMPTRKYQRNVRVGAVLLTVYTLVVVAHVWVVVSAAFGLTSDPSPKPDDMVYVGSSACADKASRIEGLCDMYAHADGSYYTAFYVDGELMFIRKSVGETYEDVWVHPYFNAI